jgi:hypothetical protein
MSAVDLSQRRVWVGCARSSPSPDAGAAPPVRRRRRFRQRLLRGVGSGAPEGKHCLLHLASGRSQRRLQTARKSSNGRKSTYRRYQVADVRFLGCRSRWQGGAKKGEVMFNRVTHDPNVLGGRATLRGLRISVAHVVSLVANGMTPALAHRVGGNGRLGRLPRVPAWYACRRVLQRRRARETIASLLRLSAARLPLGRGAGTGLRSRPGQTSEGATAGDPPPTPIDRRSPPPTTSPRRV